MNAVEIEQAVSELFDGPLDPAEFPYAFLQAFGNKETTLRKLRTGDTNKSDVGGVLQRNNIHIAVAPMGQVSETFEALRESPATAKHKVKFILATDGGEVQAAHLADGDSLVCEWPRLPDYFGFFLPLAGISTVREIRENAFDIRATSKLNRLYVELLKENPEWGTDQRRPAMNHFMARLIFSFFAEDTGIFAGDGLFTKTVAQMTEKDSSNTHDVIGALFLAMNTKHSERQETVIPRWADRLPYVNGGLFSGEMAVPRFTRTARSYLLQVGSLDWKQINPDIFGSMIQAVADDEERGALGMHYTSVPNILKVLNPLFLDDLRAKLEDSDDNPRKLLNLRSRIKRIRVFDPACGSGNFLVIAYKEMRAIEAEINRRRREADRPTEILLENFRGIELRDFAAEIARLALIIAEFQCDVRYRGERLALAEFLPLDGANWITSGNALHIDWLLLWPTGTKVKYSADDLFETPLDQPEIDFDAEAGETYICGNPPYLGSTWQSKAQKDDLKAVFTGRVRDWKLLDYVAGWFLKAADYNRVTGAVTAFVATNSICQGQQVPALWPAIFATGNEIAFAHTSFKWSNLAAHKAGVTVVIVGLSTAPPVQLRKLMDTEDGTVQSRDVPFINAYLVPGADVIVKKASVPVGELASMDFGSKPVDRGHLLLSQHAKAMVVAREHTARQFVRRYINSDELINGKVMYCVWVDASRSEAATQVALLNNRFLKVAEARLESSKRQTREAAVVPYAFAEARHKESSWTVIVPRVSSERRPYLPVDLSTNSPVVGDRNFALYDAPLWNMALIASRLHWVWIGTVCVRMRTDFSYSNTLGWNTFPVPTLTEQNKADLTQGAEEILLARETHYPATIAELYDPKKMPANLREAHERNDEVLERIYIGRRFRNDTERLEKLFEMYTKLAAGRSVAAARRRNRGRTS